MAKTTGNSFGARATLSGGGGGATYFDLPALAKAVGASLDRLPFSIRILLENLLRNEDGRMVVRDDIAAMAAWQPGAGGEREVPFLPARVLLQDFTGVPAVVDLAAMRDAMQRLGGDAKRINPQIPVDLVVDHSVQVDHYGSAAAFRLNGALEFERNRERYTFLRWGQKSFEQFNVVPPETGIVHQVNLEYLASVVFRRRVDNMAFPDTVLGTDSHTTMINGVGVCGWGVGGIEAEAVMLGQPYYLLTPQVLGFKLTGKLPAGATATDVVLTVTQILRKKGVVGKFVEFYGSGLDSLSLADRATIANMAPEYGATMGFFPVDDGTMAYLRLSGRSDAQLQLVDTYCKAQGLYRTAATPDPEFSDTVALDMGTVEPSLAGPRRPQDRVALRDMKRSFFDALTTAYNRPLREGIGVPNDAVPLSERRDLYAEQAVPVGSNGASFPLTHGAVVIAAITSCTNTSNPSVMLGAGLLAKKAVERGLTVQPWVKTSLAPGSKVVTEYLTAAGVMPALETLGFNLVGYGCTTCIGNSGPLAPAIVEAVKQHKLVVAAVLSGNRNFEGRVNPSTMANYLASPPLVVAFALAGTVDINVETEPLGIDRNGTPVFLREIWPTPAEVETAIRTSLTPEMFRTQYANVFAGDERWQQLPAPVGERYQWDTSSTYIAEPPFFREMTRSASGVRDIEGARVLALLGDSVTTDHISPAGSIPVDSPAGKYLISRGVGQKDFNSYGARRGHHEVMMRGTFGNIRLRNRLTPDVEGGWTLHLPDKVKMFIYDAAMQYQREGTPLLIIAGQEYGTGSSRDWAAKGTVLLGVRAVLAQSFERIHRSNLLGMGVLPLQFNPGETPATLGLTGTERYRIGGLDQVGPRAQVPIQVQRDDGSRCEISAIARLDSAIEVEYYRQGGILPTVLRSMLG